MQPNFSCLSASSMSCLALFLYSSSLISMSALSFRASSNDLAVTGGQAGGLGPAAAPAAAAAAAAAAADVLVGRGRFTGWAGVFFS